MTVEAAGGASAGPGGAPRAPAEEGIAELPVLDLELEAEALPDLSRQVMVLRAGAERVGLVVEEIAAVVDEGRLSIVPKAPPGVLGIMNHVGSILTVVSLPAILGLADAPAGAPRFVVVVEHGSERIGLRLDRVEGITLTVDLERDVRPGPDEAGGPAAPFTRGWLTHEEAPLRLLDSGALVDDVLARFERRERRA